MHIEGFNLAPYAPSAINYCSSYWWLALGDSTVVGRSTTVRKALGMSQISSSVISTTRQLQGRIPTSWLVHMAKAQPRYLSQSTREPAPSTHTHTRIEHHTNTNNKQHFMYAYNPPTSRLRAPGTWVIATDA